VAGRGAAAHEDPPAAARAGRQHPLQLAPSDIYDLLVERDRRAATIITSNRAVDEWVALFDDPILVNSALDRFAHRAHQIVMEGPSLRAARAPGPAKGGSRALKSAAQRG
jgi:hypothetical protein